MKNLLKCGLALAAAFSLAACSGGAGFRQLSPHTRTTKHSYRLYIKAIFYFSVVKSIKF